MTRQIRQDDSYADVVEAIETSLFEWVTAFGRGPGGDVSEAPDMTRVVSGVRYPLCNGVVRAHLSPDTVKTRVDDVIALFEGRSLPMRWWIGPSSLPADLEDYLVARGMRLADTDVGMAIDLATLSTDSVPLPANVEVTDVSDEATLKQWISTMASGFGMPEVMREGAAFYALCAQQCFGESSAFRYYIAKLDGVPVGTSQLLLRAGVAGIYYVTTLPAARRRGIGSVLTLLPLLEARVLGHRLGVLQAEEMGVSVYRKLGFQLYCTIKSYVLDV